jgi:hypothetical protein
MALNPAPWGFCVELVLALAGGLVLTCAEAGSLRDIDAIRSRRGISIRCVDRTVMPPGRLQLLWLRRVSEQFGDTDDIILHQDERLMAPSGRSVISGCELEGL